MVGTGQVTEAEADLVRTADDAHAFDAAVRSIRMRHAAPELDAAVEQGLMNEAESDAYRKQLEHGEHPRGLRSHLRRTRHQQ